VVPAEFDGAVGRSSLLGVAVTGALEEEQREDVVLLVRDLVAEEPFGLPQVVAQRLDG
jgi:hypothetical protein